MKRHRCILLLPLIILLPSCAHSQKKPQPKEILNEANVENAYPRLSRDGEQMLYQSNRTGSWQLYIMDIKTGKQTRITNDSSNNNFPDWSADNQHIAFVSDRDGNEEVYMMNADGSGLKRMTNDKERDIHPYFSPDGRGLLFNSTRTNGTLDIFSMELASGKIEQLITTDNYQETCARYSHDMKKIVFLRNNLSADDIYVMDLGTKKMENITNTPAVEHGWPVFSSDGNWVYFATKETGNYAIYRKSTATGKVQQVTVPMTGEADARPFVSYDNKTLIYNKSSGLGIAIYSISIG